MKHLHYTLLLLLSLALYAQGQPSTFLSMYNHGLSGTAVREATNGDVVVAGCTDFYYNFHWHMLSPVSSTSIHLFRTTADGGLLWERILTHPGYRVTANWMEPLPGGGFIVAGSQNQDVLWPPDSNDIVLVKTTAGGNLLWSKTYDAGHDEIGFSVVPTQDNGLLVCAFADSSPVSLTGSTFVLLLKTDSDGVVSWSKKYPVAVRDFDTGEAFPCVARETSDGGFAVTGTTSSSHQADVFILRTDSAGDLLWCRSYESLPAEPRLSTGQDILESADGNLVIAGSMDKDRTLMQYNYPFVLRVNASGAPLNAYSYESVPATSFQSGFSSVTELPAGGFLFTGMGGYGGFGDQAQLLKTDAALNTSWSRSYTWDGLATMGTRSGRAAADGGFLFTGKRQFDGTVLFKTDASGLVPCKNPGILIRSSPSLQVMTKTPAVVSGIAAAPLPMVSTSPLTDTSWLCPLQTLALPVDWLSVSAAFLPEQAAIRIRWATASETGNERFEVERSGDGIHFVLAGSVPGAGTSAMTRSYAFTDAYPPPDRPAYYRIAQVDYDGQKKYSATVSVSGTHRLTADPAVIADRVLREVRVLMTPGSAHGDAVLYDLSGRQVGHLSPADGGRDGVVRYGLPLLPHGLYIFTLPSGGERLYYKLVW
jgi:hypothetical protein